MRLRQEVSPPHDIRTNHVWHILITHPLMTASASGHTLMPDSCPEIPEITLQPLEKLSG